MTEQIETRSLKLPGMIRESHLEPCAAWFHHLRQVEERAQRSNKLIPLKLKRVLDRIWDKAVEAARNDIGNNLY